MKGFSIEFIYLKVSTRFHRIQKDVFEPRSGILPGILYCFRGRRGSRRHAFAFIKTRNFCEVVGRLFGCQLQEAFLHKPDETEDVLEVGAVSQWHPDWSRRLPVYQIHVIPAHVTNLKKLNRYQGIHNLTLITLKYFWRPKVLFSISNHHH